MTPVQVVPSLTKVITLLKTDVLDGGSMGLFQNDITPNESTVIGDLTVATFTGYAPVTLTTYALPYLIGNNQAAVNSPLASFRPASPFTVGNQVYGFFVLDTDGALLACGRFDDPVSMTDAGDFLELIYRHIIGNP